MFIERLFRGKTELDELAQQIADCCIDRQAHEYSPHNVAEFWRRGGEPLRTYLKPYFRLVKKTGGDRDAELKLIKRLSPLGWDRYLAAKNCTLE